MKKFKGNKPLDQQEVLNIQIQIQNYSETHDLAIVTTRKGYSYACLWAKDGELTKEEVKQAWKESRKNFDPWYGRLACED